MGCVGAADWQLDESSALMLLSQGFVSTGHEYQSASARWLLARRGRASVGVYSIELLQQLLSNAR